MKFSLFRQRRSLLAMLPVFVTIFQGCGGGSASDGDTGTATAMAAEVSAEQIESAATTVSINAIRSRPATPPTPVTAIPITPAAAATLTIRAHAQLAANIGPMVQVRIGGIAVGRFEVRSTDAQDYTVPATGLSTGTKVELVYLNDEAVSGQDRNLFVAYVSDGINYVAPSQPGVVFDQGNGSAAFNGQNVSAGTEAIREGGALRILWPNSAAAIAADTQMAASRFLQQASFGPTRSEVERVARIGHSVWIDEQLALPVISSYLPYIQKKYNQGADFLPPKSEKYTPDWLTQKFWANAIAAPDQLRKRTAYALHSIFVTSLVDSNLFHHARAHAQYMDTLDRLAFGNYRDLIEEVALSPVMGLYLSHIRNQKEDPVTKRQPDENFARELMQLFTIGLYELNIDGTPKLDGQGHPVETYNNADVMELAKVFTGWSWGFDDNALTEYNFLWNWPWPEAGAQGNARADIRRMKTYPGLHSTAEKRLFAGKSNAVTIPANTSASASLRIALDTLFRHPNVGPFIGRQLIQRLVTSNPSSDYVRRVAAVFNNNGRGVRGDLGAVIRAVLLDQENLSSQSIAQGKLREPVLRLAHSLRAFGGRSKSGEFLMATEPLGLGQRAHHSPSVFGYFRPGYTPPETLMPGFTGTAPEFQIVDESSTANWVNAVELMLREGIGWHGTSRDVTLPLDLEASVVGSSPEHLMRHLELLLFTGRMPAELRKDIMDAIQGVGEAPTERRDKARVRVALLVALTSPEYLIQR